MIYRFIIPLMILMVWQSVAYFGGETVVLLSSPVNIFESGLELLSNKNILNDLNMTLYRILISFAMGSFIGITIGILMGIEKRIYNLFEFSIDFFRSIPAIALFPVFIIFFGIDEASKIAVAVYGTSLVMVIYSYYGIINSSTNRIELARFWGFSKFCIFRKVLIYEALPYIFAGGRIALSLSIILTIVVEMIIGSDYGLGGKLQEFHLVFEIEKMYFIIFLIGVIGFALNKIFQYIEKKVIFWRELIE